MRKITIAESKSIANRMLIVNSLLEQELPVFKTKSTDVLELRAALLRVNNNETEFSIKDGGTSLRFLLARLSRLDKIFTINVGAHLISRPHDELLKTLKSLGCTVQRSAKGFSVKACGWNKETKLVEIDCSKTSQVASAVLMSAINLDYDFSLRLLNSTNSSSYFLMTVNLLRQFGFDIKQNGNTYTLSPMRVQLNSIQCEADMSSFAAAVAVVLVQDKQAAEIFEIPNNSLQADMDFIEILQAMHADIKVGQKTDLGYSLVVTNSLQQLQAIQINLQQTPDLFPILAALCALSTGESVLSGLELLKYKESDRLIETSKLLKRCGIKVDKISAASVRITGGLSQIRAAARFDFDPKLDHRLAMAAAILKYSGANINIIDKQVVNKSFAEFWQI